MQLKAIEQCGGARTSVRSNIRSGHGSKIPGSSARDVLLRTEVRAPVTTSAFTLIEVIGVLAILAVLAALMLPSCIKRIDIATRNQEKVNLAGITEALAKNLLRGQNVPDHTTWNAQAASWSEMPVSRVSTNARRYQRFYYSLENPSVTLPYSQNWNGLNARPQRMRAVSISILGGDMLTPGANAPTLGPLEQTGFDALWNLADGTRPSNDEWANWKGRGDDFLVTRIDYAPMFHRLVLVNRDPNLTPGFKIDASDTLALPRTLPNYGWDKYYVQDTVVGLCSPAGTVTNRYVLTQDIGFVFENGMWRGQIMGGTETLSQAEEFEREAARFLASKWRTTSAKGADQQTALAPMYAFMLTYTFWADLCPHFPARTSSGVNVPEYKLLLDFAGDGGGTGHGLDDITGENGLLKK
ncbi:MAG TPA: hypothetical protein VJA21_18360 [Verrucomicrobiae bacterium]